MDHSEPSLGETSQSQESLKRFRLHYWWVAYFVSNIRLQTVIAEIDLILLFYLPTYSYHDIFKHWASGTWQSQLLLYPRHICISWDHSTAYFIINVYEKPSRNLMWRDEMFENIKSNKILSVCGIFSALVY